MLHLWMVALILLIWGGLILATYPIARHPVYLLPSAFVYFWSLHGAFVYSLDSVLGVSERRYYALFDQMLFVSLDDTYVTTILLYGLFCLTFQFVWSWLTLKTFADITVAGQLRIVDQRYILPMFLAGLLTATALYLYSPVVQYSLSQNVSAYGAQRDILSATGYATFILATRLSAAISMWEIASTPLLVRIPAKLFHAANISLIVLVCLFGGGKGELLAVGVQAFVMITLSVRPIRLLTFTAVGTLAATLLAVVDTLRFYTVQDIAAGDATELGFSALLNIWTSAEAFAGHFSLYAILQADVSASWSEMWLALLSSFSPVFLGLERAPSLYYTYAVQSGISLLQGFTLHNGAGWYMVAGVAGLVLGGAYLALAVGGPLVLLAQGISSRLLSIFCFAFVCGELAQMLRTPAIEPAKSWLQHILLGFLLFTIFNPKVAPIEKRNR